MEAGKNVNNLEIENNEQGDMVLVSNSDLQEVIKKNVELSQEILKISKYIKRYVFWQKIFNYFKLALIVIPIALAILYLPPFLKEISGSFQFIFESLSLISNPEALQGAISN